MSVDTTFKLSTIAALGLFAGATIWLWQVAGDGVFLAKAMAFAATCF